MPDTSCVVPALSPLHEHHERVTRELAGRFDRGETLIMAGPVLIEAYSVLTRVPRPIRGLSAGTRTSLQETFVSRAAEIAVLDARAYWQLVEQAPEREITGGAVYDAVIAACAVAARVDVLLTFNDRHFRRLLAGLVEVVVPT